MLSRSIQPASRLRSHAPSEAWRFAGLTGAIAELSGQGATATAALAMRMVYEAQRAGEPVAWISLRTRCFYPPDALANGVDLAALAVVRLESAASIGKAADYLVRSGAFGLVVLDLGPKGRLHDRQLTRLLSLARKHGTAILCLTHKPETAPSLGALVSVRGAVTRERLAPGLFECELRALKDKRQAPGWRHAEVFYGPAGLR